MGAEGIGHIIIYQSLQPSFPTLLQMATNAGLLHVTVINYTGDLGKVESNLQQFDSFSILREVGANEEVTEEEVAAANHLLDLLADDTRRGRLEEVSLPKAVLLLCTEWVERLGGRKEVEESVWNLGWDYWNCRARGVIE